MRSLDTRLAGNEIPSPIRHLFLQMIQNSSLLRLYKTGRENFERNVINNTEPGRKTSPHKILLVDLRVIVENGFQKSLITVLQPFAQ